MTAVQPSPERVAAGMGWASIGLGLPQLTRPGDFADAIGVGASTSARAWILAVGIRELAAAAAIAAEQPRPVRAMWARVAGDAMDAALLTAALRARPDRPDRIRGALGAVLGIAAVDLTTALRLQKVTVSNQEEPMRVTAAITTIKSREEVERAWAGSSEIAELASLGSLDVSFTNAPGDRGTEIRVTVDADVAGGPVGASLKKLAGTSPRQQAFDHLRRFKQVLETGEVARSDGTPEGHTAKSQPKQRPAQPVEHTAT